MTIRVTISVPAANPPEKAVRVRLVGTEGATPLSREVAALSPGASTEFYLHSGNRLELEEIADRAAPPA